jgi:hypothetical protein
LYRYKRLNGSRFPGRALWRPGEARRCTAVHQHTATAKRTVPRAWPLPGVSLVARLAWDLASGCLGKKG